MDTEVFLERCEEIDIGLRKLADDLYESVTEGEPGEVRDDLVRRAKEKIKLFDKLSADIEDEAEEEEIEWYIRYIDSLKEDLGKLD